MRALVLGDLPPRVVLDHPFPVPTTGEALVDVSVAGVCDTDLQLVRGYMGFRGIPGHEFVGTVRESDDPRWVGKRVVADINAGCGECEDCRTRAGHHCAKQSVLGILNRSGAFAEQLTIPNRCLVEVPADLDDVRAVFAEPLAAALHVLDEGSALRSSDRIVVLGDGKLGLLIAMALRGAGHPTALVGRHEAKLAIARRSGVETSLQAEATAFSGATMVVDATGNGAGIALAMKLVRPRGTIVLKTTIAGATSIDLAPLVIDELRVVGSRCGDMASAIAALSRGDVDPLPLIEARYPLRRADEALAHAGRKGALKILIERD